MVWFVETRRWWGRWHRNGWPMEWAEATAMAIDMRANGLMARVVRV
jgi:hypothetical protein